MIAPVREVPVLLRAMAHDDITHVSDIERSSYEFPWSHGVFRDCLLAGYSCSVLERAEHIVGYAILSVAAGEAHILNLCVDSNYRRHGYGEQLLDEIISRAQSAEVREIFLEVRPSNQGAVALYAKRQFRQFTSRPAYYQAQDGREDAAVYSLRLKKPSQL
jgi:ribosomal-protein-alanine N-acetyltransferase